MTRDKITARCLAGLLARPSTTLYDPAYRPRPTGDPTMTRDEIAARCLAGLLARPSTVLYDPAYVPPERPAEYGPPSAAALALRKADAQCQRLQEAQLAAAAVRLADALLTALAEE